MATTIKLKNSVTTTNTPSSLAQGEVAINITDKKVWVGNAATTPIQLVGDGASASFGALSCTTLSASGVATFSAGTVSAPAITTSGDTNTGIFFPAADTIAFTEGGVEAMRITDAGRLGIGTTSPLYVLETSSSEGTVRFGRTVNGAGQDTSIIRMAANNSSSAMTDYAWFAANITSATAGSESGSIQLYTKNSGTMSERMRITSAGNVGIGETSPSATYRTTIKGNYSSIIGGTLYDNGGGDQMIVGFASATSPSFVFSCQNATGNMTFGTNNTERMRIDSSGVLLVGMTSASNTTAGFFTSANGTVIVHTSSSTFDQPLLINRHSSTGVSIQFRQANVNVGSVSVTASATAYNTSSDYRLKENIAPMTSALAKVAQLKPVTYTWKIDGAAGQGFIAHELQEIVPDCVTGEKDAVDADGKPVYQGVDTSFLVATLTSAIQELHEIVKAQAAEIALLKSK